MLADHTRMRRYRRAIEAVVGPDDVVADLGTGTGVLAIIAAQAGARRVYAIDQRAPSLAVAAQLVQSNHVGDRVQLVEGDARTVELPEPVDVIINELIGNFGTDERIVECVRDFAGRHLRAGGRVLPSRLRTWLHAVEYTGEFRGVWSEDFHGIDMRAGNSSACHPEAVMYGLRELPRDLAEPFLLEDVQFGLSMPERPLEIELEFEATRSGNLQGFAGSFDAVLAPGIEIGTYPAYAGCHWENWHWPVSPPLPVAPGQRLSGRLEMPLGGDALGWKLDWSIE
jgi:protein arginine N-methyltransferase 1